MTSKRTRDRLVKRLQEQGIKDKRVLDAIGQTPRHWFLDEALAHRAYEDSALPIGYGQTLSQPYIVARMTELILAAKIPLVRVLEIGTGSGYQTAILAQLVDEVWSVERIKPLQVKARARLQELRCRNVYYKHGDGGQGWPVHAPFDAILAAAAPTAVPQQLLQQLAPGGVLVIPVGEEQQHLVQVTRQGDGDQYDQRQIEPVKFVPLLPGTTNR